MMKYEVECGLLLLFGEMLAVHEGDMRLDEMVSPAEFRDLVTVTAPFLIDPKTKEGGIDLHFRDGSCFRVTVGKTDAGGEDEIA